MELTSIMNLGRVSKTVEIVKGFTVTLHTPSYGEQLAIIKEVPKNLNDNPVLYYHQVQVESLAVVTEKINDKNYTSENRDELRDIFSNMQYNLLQEIYNAYLKLVDEQAKIIEELKKKA